MSFDCGGCQQNTLYIHIHSGTRRGHGRGLSTLESYSESKIERRLSAADGEVCPTWESVTWLLSRPVSARISSLGPLDKLLTSMIRSMGGEERDSTGDTGDRLREVGGSASPVAGVVVGRCRILNLAGFRRSGLLDFTLRSVDAVSGGGLGRIFTGVDFFLSFLVEVWRVERLSGASGRASAVAGRMLATSPVPLLALVEIIVRLGSRLMVALVAGSPKERRGPDKISRIDREISLGNELAPGGGGIAIWRGPEDSGVGSSSEAGD